MKTGATRRKSSVEQVFRARSLPGTNAHDETSCHARLTREKGVRCAGYLLCVDNFYSLTDGKAETYQGWILSLKVFTAGPYTFDSALIQICGLLLC